MRIAAVGDIHCSARPDNRLIELLSSVEAQADVLLFCGDLTDYGLPEEIDALASILLTIPHLPKVAVLGNHDFESGFEKLIRERLAQTGVSVLDGTSVVIGGVGFAGVKGFGGGFTGHTLEAWGEEVIKNFVHEASNEEIKLDAALARLEDVPRVAIMHYSPIRDTIVGEPPEIFPFLGSSRLESALLRHPVIAVFHGHAHHGVPEGRLKNGTPVYNVSMPLLMRTQPHLPAVRILEIHPEATSVPMPGGGAEIYL